MPDHHLDNDGKIPKPNPSDEKPDEDSNTRNPLIALDILWAVLSSPSTAFAFITHRRPLILALLVAVAVAVMAAFLLVPNPPELAEVILGLDKGTLAAAPVFAFWVAFFLLAVAIQALVVHLLALALRGNGSYAGIFTGICFAYFPGLLAAPLAWIRAALDSMTGNVLYSVLFALICLWIVALAIFATRHNYGLSTPRAAAACLLTGFFLVILPPLIVVLSLTL